MIVMAGMIGAGKTTYTTKIAEELQTQPFYEAVDENPILNKYYEDPEKYGFALQIYFLNKRFKSIKEAFFDQNNVLDRSIYEDALFTKINVDNGNISEEEYQLYLALLDNMMEELSTLPKKAPDLMVYLDASFEHILANIKKRGRSFEQPTEENGLLSYYKQLHTAYGDWFEQYNHGPKLRIDADRYDVNNEKDWQNVFDQIQAKLNGKEIMIG
ncbi:deoxynucleoside kinase [Tetragenococcus muriaticus]|uniref:Deoxyadenosine kinase/deoxyguanosine kinase n=1 Tax=Tetragenococcus muriaticus 3MR10-3 TaxID=1302648 RepID=A0A091C4K3_9ENTE|nr:deoxynucleoside kinase [Tetragenococcus muriaticus]KFN92766.1 deoxyadenosine kinase/deoxyguanosine kinase [Tetragenococcus muriaticus 3MR10-3]